MTGEGTGARPLDKRALAFSCVVGSCLFASLCASLAANRLVEETLPEFVQPFMAWLPADAAASIAILAGFGILIGAGLYFLLTRFGAIDAALRRMRPLRWMRLGFSAGDVVRAALAIFALWIPVIAISFPTGLTADTFNQLYQFQTSAPTFYPTTGETVDAEFIDHHPVFDTLLYGLFWRIGDVLGSQDAGIFALAVLQSAVLATELGALTCYLARLGTPYALRLAALVFFAWFPFFPHYAATVLKDTTYLTVFLPWALMWAEAVRTRGGAFASRRFLVAFMLLGGLCVLAKKLGAFVLVCCLAVLACVMRGHRLKLAIGGLVTLAVFCVMLPALVYPAIGGVAPGGSQEALGPAIQQVTALAREDEGSLSDDEREACDRVFDLDRAVGAYTAFRSDAAKSTFRSAATGDDIAAFLRVWLAGGLRRPDVYLVSTLETSGMLYIPSMKLTYYSGDDMTGRAKNYAERNPEFAVTVAQPKALVELNDYLEFDSPESKLSDLPVISLFFTEGFYGGWIPFIAFALVLYARGRRPEGPGCGDVPGNADEDVPGKAEAGPYRLTALAPFAVSFAFLLVSPVASPRYILPLLFTAPLQLAWAWNALPDSKSPTSER